MSRSVPACQCHGRSSASGANASSISEARGCRTNLAVGARPPFSPEVVMLIKAMACELPVATGLPLSRFSRQDLVREAARRGIVAQISGTTIWRWLDADAIRPWHIAVGFFPVTSTSPKKPAGCWISTRAGGKTKRCAETSSSSPPTKRLAFRPAFAFSLHCPQNPASRCAWSLNTNAVVPWPISPPGMCVARSSLGSVVRRPASNRFADWSER